MIEFSPAILTNDISDFRKKYADILALTQYFTKLHIDFIDGVFIHNKTIMPVDLKFLQGSTLTLVAHFMTMNPKQYFADAKLAGFKWVLFHYEAFGTEQEIQDTIATARQLKLRPGLVINPETPLYMLAKFIPDLNLIQLMGIHAGFQGQMFMVATISRVKELRALSKNVIIMVDGGVKVGIARQLAMAGADILVAGSAILKSEDEEMAIEALQADVET